MERRAAAENYGVQKEKYINIGFNSLNWFIMEKKRRTSIFEKLLLVVGFLVLIIGYFFINRVFVLEGYKVTWGFLQTVFLWLLMVIFIILLAIGEDIKEGILLEQLDEIRQLKEAFLKRKNR